MACACGRRARARRASARAARERQPCGRKLTVVPESAGRRGSRRKHVLACRRRSDAHATVLRTVRSGAHGDCWRRPASRHASRFPRALTTLALSPSASGRGGGSRRRCPRCGGPDSLARAQAVAEPLQCLGGRRIEDTVSSRGLPRAHVATCNLRSFCCGAAAPQPLSLRRRHNAYGMACCQLHGTRPTLSAAQPTDEAIKHSVMYSNIVCQTMSCTKRMSHGTNTPGWCSNRHWRSYRGAVSSVRGEPASSQAARPTKGAAR